MAKVKRRAFNHSGLLFLGLIFVIFIVINCLPFVLKGDPPDLLFDGQAEVSILSKLPITDISAKELKLDTVQDGIIGYSEFSVKLPEDVKTEVKYEIYLDDISETETFKYDYVKVYLTDSEGNPYKQYLGNKVPSYKDLRVSLNDPSKKILLSDTIKLGEEKKFKLRIWLSDTYVLNNIEKEFKGKISVKTIS